MIVMGRHVLARGVRPRPPSHRRRKETLIQEDGHGDADPLARMVPRIHLLRDARAGLTIGLVPKPRPVSTT
jgi:hypothetical protein